MRSILSSSTHPIFDTRVTPTKLQVDGLDEVFGTHKIELWRPSGVANSPGKHFPPGSPNRERAPFRRAVASGALTTAYTKRP
jgi:hypothetical protein